MISSKPVFVAVLLIALTLAVPLASATVSNSTGFSGDLVTGAPITVSYTKTTDDAGDGQQTGSVTLTWSTSDGCAFGADLSLGSEAYDFSSPGSEEVTWTFRTPCAGTYDFTFNDAVTSGTELDDTDSLEVEPAFVLDWQATISGGTDGNENTFTNNLGGFEVDDAGRVFIAYSLDHDGDGGADRYVRAFDRSGGVLWADRVATSDDLLGTTRAMVYDQAKRLIVLDCYGPTSSPSLVEMVAFGASNGNSEVLATLTGAPLSVGNCPTGKIDAFSVGADDTAIFVPMTASAANTDNLLVRFDGAGDIVWQTTVSRPQGLSVQHNGTHGLFLQYSSSSGCGGSCGLRSFNVDTGAVFGSGATPALGQVYDAPDDPNEFFGVGTDSTSLVYLEATASGSGVSSTESGLVPARIVLGDFLPDNSVAQGIGGGGRVDADGRVLACGGYRESSSSYPWVGLTNGGGSTAMDRYLNPQGDTAQGGVITTRCLGVGIDPVGGFFVAFAGGFESGAILNEVILQHYSTTEITPQQPEPQANIPVGPTTGGPSVIPPTAGGDVGEGLLGFCSSLMGGSTAALFFCGLILVVIVFLATAAAYAGLVMFGDNKGGGPWPALSGTVGGFAMMIFNVMAGIWSLVWAVVLIVIVAAILSVLMRRIFLGSGGSNE